MEAGELGLGPAANHYLAWIFQKIAQWGCNSHVTVTRKILVAAISTSCQQICTHSIASRVPSFFNVLEMCPTPTAQWCAGP